MEIPTEITFKDLAASDALAAKIHEWVGRLEHVYDRINRCEVLVETPHRHHRQGRQYHVRVRLTVPRGEIVASHDPGPNEAHEDPYVAVRDTFQAVRRQLEDYVRKLRGEAPKRHRAPQVGTVSFLDIEGRWGWIDVDQSSKVHFNRDAVSDGFDQLAVGDEVQFTEQEGEAMSVERFIRQELPAS